MHFLLLKLNGFNCVLLKWIALTLTQWSSKNQILYLKSLFNTTKNPLFLSLAIHSQSLKLVELSPPTRPFYLSRFGPFPDVNPLRHCCMGCHRHRYLASFLKSPHKSLCRPKSEITWKNNFHNPAGKLFRARTVIHFRGVKFRIINPAKLLWV